VSSEQEHELKYISFGSAEDEQAQAPEKEVSSSLSAAKLFVMAVCLGRLH
jgi:hypothetical protein